MHDTIIEKLARIEREEDVAVLFACESGSRAWGFPSTDSDWDVRFVYVRRPEWYLSIDVATRRDVIELPIDDALDINGWDLPKALRLFRKSNPPLQEWLGSPIVYMDRDDFGRRLRDLRPAFLRPRTVAYHYARMATRAWTKCGEGDTVVTKQVFYTLRTLLAVLWIRADRGVVPTPFQPMIDALITDADVMEEVRTMLERKRSGTEAARSPRPPAIDRFVRAHLPQLESVAADTPPEAAGPTDRLDELFRQSLTETWRS